ncbi:hypothetical protein ACJMK2_005093, partial [Sinanodonta woodiana]
MLSLDLQPPNDPFGIKKEDLILGLRGCLSASPKFAEFCLPLLVEKLTSDIVSAKIDSLQTLTACLEVYDPDSLREFQSTFFDCIKKEVFYSGDATLEAVSLDCLKALVKVLSRGISQKGDRKSLDDFLNEIVNECQQHLLKPELKIMLLTGQLLCAAAAGSDTSCCRLVHVYVPLLLEQASKCTLILQRRNIFEVLSWFITVTAEFQFGQEDPNPLVMYKDSLLSHYILLLSDENKLQLQLLAATSFRNILSLTGVLSKTDIDNITDSLLNCAMQTTVADVRQLCCSALSLLSSSSPDTVISRVLPELISRLNTDPMDADGESDPKVLTSKAVVMETMASLASHPLVIEKVSYQLMSHLQSSCSREKDGNLEEMCHTAKCLFQVVSAGVSYQTLPDFFHSNILPAIYDFAIALCKKYFSREETKVEDLLSSLACSIRAIVTHLEKTQLETLLNTVVKLYLDGSCEDMNLKHLPHMDKFRPLQVEWNEYSPMVTLLTSVLCAVPTHVSIPREIEILQILTKLVKSWCSSRYPQTALYKLLAGLVNKLNN